MKTLKLDHERAQAVRNGRKNVTWRINDDKNLSVDDRIQLVDKVDANNPRTWLVIGEAVITEIIIKHLGAVTKSDMALHEKYSTSEDMYAQYQRFYGNDVGPKTPVKIIHFDFDPYGDAVAFNPELMGNIREAKVYADGGSRGNPGPSAAGYAIFDMQDNVIKKEGIYLGLTTNNQAEYQAIRLGLEAAKAMGVETVHAYLDSLLVVNQMKGIFKVKNIDLIPVHAGVKEVVAQFKHVTFTHVPREFNKVADGMVNEALDKAVTSN
jgi:ribonuclease HI